MTFAIALTFIILIITFIIFALDIWPIDFVAFAVMGTILVLGPILNVTPEEAISGFSNPATITVLAMFILSGGVRRTGMINLLAQRMVQFAGDSQLKQLVTVMLVVSPISAFINNTAAVAILIPSVITLAREHQQAPSKLLIPLSFFSQLAGVVTLIGTSTNILASNLLGHAGYYEFSMFEFAGTGLMVFATGSLYLLAFSPKLLPERRVETIMAEDYRMKEYLSDVVVMKNSPLIGQTLLKSGLRETHDIHVFEIIRHGEKLAHPLRDQVFQENDVLLIRVDTSQLFKIKQMAGLAIEPERQYHSNLESEKRHLLEVVIGSNSDLIEETIRSSNFRYHYNCTVIAIRKQGTVIRDKLNRVKLGFGDTLLLRGTEPALAQIKREPSFIATEAVKLEEFRTDKIMMAMIIIIGVVIGAVTGVPILITALVGCVLMVLTGCLTMHEVHESIRWDVIFLLAGVIPLGLAMENTGGAQLLADLVAISAHYLPPILVLTNFYLVSAVMTAVISNNATVVVLVPVAIATAETLGLDARSFVLAIMFAASNSFATPVGYQTNTMVYGPGGYRFLDFTKIGLPLNLLLAIATPLYIYLFWGV